MYLHRHVISKAWLTIVLLYGGSVIATLVSRWFGYYGWSMPWSVPCKGVARKQQQQQQHHQQQQQHEHHQQQAAKRAALQRRSAGQRVPSILVYADPKLRQEDHFRSDLVRFQFIFSIFKKLTNFERWRESSRSAFFFWRLLLPFPGNREATPQPMTSSKSSLMRASGAKQKEQVSE